MPSALLHFMRLFPQENNVDMELVAMTLAEVASAMDYLHTHRITHR
jgi:serine/threonine protein kinase